MIPASQPDPRTLQVAKPPPAKSSALKLVGFALSLDLSPSGFSALDLFSLSRLSFWRSLPCLPTGWDRESRYWFHRSDLASFASSFRSLFYLALSRQR